LRDDRTEKLGSGKGGGDKKRKGQTFQEKNRTGKENTGKKKRDSAPREESPRVRVSKNAGGKRLKGTQ